MSKKVGEHGNAIADDDKIFVCLACGKVSPDRYGDRKITGSTPRSHGWDESCMLHCEEFPIAILVWDDTRTRVIGLKS